MLSNVLTTDNSLHGSFYTGEILVIILFQRIYLVNGCINLSVVCIFVNKSSNRILDCFRHCIHFTLLRNVLVTLNGIDSGFHTGEILVIILFQRIYLVNGCINLSVVCIFVNKSSNRILDCFRHCIHFTLLRNVLVTLNGIDSGFHTGEILVIILFQRIYLVNGCINLSVVCIFVNKSSNRILDCFRHCIHFTLLRNVLVTLNGIDSGFHTGEILVIILFQRIYLVNGCINLSVVCIFVNKSINRILDCFCHCIHFTLLGNVLVTDNGIDSGFYTREVLVVVLVQCISFCNGCVNLSVVCIFVNKGSNCILYCFRHCIYFTLLSNVLVTNNGIDSGYYIGEVIVVVTIQVICLGNGCVYSTVICRAILKSRIIACLRKRIAQRTSHCAICKIFILLFRGRTSFFRRSARSKEAIRISDSTAAPQVARKNAGSLGHSISHGRKRCLIHIAILNSQC